MPHWRGGARRAPSDRWFVCHLGALSWRSSSRPGSGPAVEVASRQMSYQAKVGPEPGKFAEVEQLLMTP